MTWGPAVFAGGDWGGYLADRGVIRDILHRLSDRFPVHVLVAPVLVQGDGAKHQIAAAIAGFNSRARWGGAAPDRIDRRPRRRSLEDLWAFNEEEVVARRRRVRFR